ncbi:MAG: hypothetical protein AB9856_05910 [Cellulosilyticaceae bacterium]
MAVYKPIGRKLTGASLTGHDCFKLTITVINAFSLMVVTGVASITGALYIWENSTSSGVLHTTYTNASQKYAVTCRNNTPLTYKFIRK